MTSIFKSQMIKYGIVGIFSTLLHIGTAFLFAHFFLESLLVANSVGFIFAFSFSYFFHSRIVFVSDLTFKKAIKFLLVQGASLLLAVKTAELMENFSIYFKILIVALLLPVITFFVHKMWTFADHRKHG